VANKKRSLPSNISRRAFSSIFKKSATQKYPFVPASVAEGFRGKQVFDIEKCISCGLCSKDCPANAIEMIDFEGKKRPLFYLDRCVFCFQCADTCPKKAIQPSSIFELACIDKKTLELKPQPVPVSVKQPTV